MTDIHSEDDDRKLVSDELKAARAQRGWSSQEVANMIGFSQSTIKNIESGQRAPTPEQAEALDRVFGTSGTFQRMERRIRGIPFSAGFRPFTPHEQKAWSLRIFEHSMVPGLFQTSSYAQAIMEKHPETDAETVKEQVDGRLSRQAVLFRSDPPPPRIVALLAEQALYANIGGPAVMAGQLEHVLELADMPRITIQVIPNQSHPGLLGAFMIAETDQRPDLVYLETTMGGQVMESYSAAERMAVMFDTLRGEALTVTASLDLIKEAAQRWQDRIAP